MKILVTGGTGFIGSHTVVELVGSGHEIVIVDSLVNSSEDVVERLEAITGVKIPFYRVDIRDKAGLSRVFKEHSFECCIHFAGLKAVGESVLNPLMYYDNNVGGTLALLEVMEENNCKNIVFSSSATVYGDASSPISESCPKGQCTNPYGQTKSMIEDILASLHTADLKKKAEKPWNVVLLRYFNPIGAHKSGLIGEKPNGIPNNLMPYITQVASGKLEKLHVFGGDYDTHDGTGVRDYIHVVDLARGHVKALEAIKKNCGVAVYNLGTGTGYSVLDLVKTFMAVNHLDIPYVMDARRPGDIAVCYSDPTKAFKELGWKAEYGIEDMCRDSWAWEKKNLEKEHS